MELEHLEQLKHIWNKWNKLKHLDRPLAGRRHVTAFHRKQNLPGILFAGISVRSKEVLHES